MHMAVIHRAYTFDPARFHLMLRQDTIDGGVLREDRLLMAAREAVATASPTMRQALEMVRFDEEWVDRPGEDEAAVRAREWYIILLTSTLSSAPSLTHRFPVGWIVLERVLPLAGWTPEDVRRLVRGDRLDTLVASSGDDVFASYFRGVNQVGGWLDVDGAATLRGRLQGAARCFSPSDGFAVEAATPIAALWSRDPHEVLQSVYADVSEMLETAVERRHALFLVLD